MTGIRPIPGFERYGITHDGIPYRLTKRGSDKPLAVPRQLKPELTDRYLQIGLYEDGQRRMRYVHDLVALAWLGPRPPGAEVHHRNRDRSDNAASNLEYKATHVDHSIEHLDQVLRKLTPEQVIEMRTRYAAGGVTQYQLADEYGIHQKTVHSIIHGKLCRHVELVASAA